MSVPCKISCYMCIQTSQGMFWKWSISFSLDNIIRFSGREWLIHINTGWNKCAWWSISYWLADLLLYMVFPNILNQAFSGWFKKILILINRLSGQVRLVMFLTIGWTLHSPFRHKSLYVTQPPQNPHIIPEKCCILLWQVLHCTLEKTC